MLGVAEMGRDPYSNIDANDFFAPAVQDRLYAADRMTWRGKALGTDQIRLQLARHIVLPWAWNRQRYVGALATIGSAKNNDRDTGWRQDGNHGVTLWLPWGIGFVTGGNHSITAGILAGEGHVQPDEAYDMSYLLDELACDGLHYRCRRTGKKICPVPDPRTAAVFEIGRLMRDFRVVPFIDTRD
ncbi:hypothetical protein CupriaWKF_12510 [Cupriavidus sp. WKF15]|nr:DUF6710 family protein [Cupriavidus sp. WKF15]WER45129.1 hypothetical protein CupriaWKF_12510 [Cupriavidus sp. WKF15]